MLYTVMKVVVRKVEGMSSPRTVSTLLSKVVAASEINWVEVEASSTVELIVTGLSALVMVAASEELGEGTVAKVVIRCVMILVAC